MSLMTLDFWGATLLFFFVGLLVVLGRFIWWLAAASERTLSLLTQTGLHGLAKTLLGVLIGYTGRTYKKNPGLSCGIRLGSGLRCFGRAR